MQTQKRIDAKFGHVEKLFSFASSCHDCAASHCRFFEFHTEINVVLDLASMSLPHFLTALNCLKTESISLVLV